MSTSDQTTNSSNVNFTKIFESATNEYKTITGQDLGTHPFGAALESLKSPDDILGVFRTQAQEFDEVYKGNEKLMTHLTPIVHVLFTVSATANGLVSPGPPFVPYCSVMTSTFSQSRPQSQSSQGLASFSG
jgi:hypothetical protein